MTAIDSSGKFRNHALAVTLMAAVVLPYPGWTLGAVYHKAFAAWEIVMVMATAAAAVFTACKLLDLTLGRRWFLHLADAAVFLILFYLAQGVVRAALPDIVSFPKPLRVALSGVALLAACCLPWLRGHSRYARLRLAALVFTVVFTFSPWLLSLGAPHRQLPLPNIGTDQARIYVVLDELGQASADDLFQRLRARGFAVAVRQAPSVGTNTINALPEIMGGPHMPNANACSPTAVCDSAHVFDFAKLDLNSAAPLHMVGIFHPYCSARGWASCVQSSMATESPWRSFACVYFRMIPDGWRLCDWVELERWAAFKADFNSDLWASPFWQQGGILIVHAPVPHPPGPLPGGTLSQDYAATLLEAEALLVALHAKATERFGSRFEIFGTSDHPIRAKIWCATQHYIRAGCDPLPFEADVQVPIFSLSPKATAPTPPPNNGRLLMD